MMGAQDKAAWRFVTALYAQPGVGDACLTLQDEAGVDVIHMLGLLYGVARLRLSLDVAAVEASGAVVDDWRAHAVAPIRALRRDLKHEVGGVADAAREGLRGEIKRLELAAEAIELDVLVVWLRQRHRAPTATAALSIEALLEVLAPGAIPAIAAARNTLAGAVVTTAAARAAK